MRMEVGSWNVRPMLQEDESEKWACGHRPHAAKTYNTETAQENNSGRCIKGQPKRKKDYDMRMEVGNWNVRTMLQEDESEKLEREL